MNLHHVNLVAHYESKLLSRSVTFFILVLVTIGILLFFNIWVYRVFNEPWYFSEYDHDDLETTWTIFAAFRKDLLFLPASMPYANAVLFNILQSVIVIFVGGDFVMRHRMGRANEVLEIRSLGNREYILGKCLGQIRLILWLNLISVLIALMINLFGSEQVCSPLFYLFYFFTLTFPSLLFIMGLTVLVKSLVRPEVLAILILLFFGCLNMLVISTIDHGVFDYLALCVPNLFSTLTGHPALGGYLLQRLVFLFIGFGLFSFAICFLRRLPNHLICKRLHVMDGLMFWGVAFIFMLYYLVPFHRVDERREAYVTMYKKYNHKAKVNTLSHDIIFRQENKRYEATSRMVVKNRGTRIIDTLIFYLNPGLNVDRVIAREKTLDFHREAQVLNVVGEKFFPGDSLSIEIRYAGTIDESVCYPDISKEEFWHQKLRDVFLCTGRRFAFLEESYTLLTPECLWYPVSVPGVDVENPFMSRGDFTRYRLQVVHPGSRIAVSQGTVSKVGDTLQFLNHQDMFGITLSMGLFQEDNIALEKCSYVFYDVRDHFYLEGVFRNISSEMKLDVCQEYFTKDCFRFPYPFQKMAMVEVPVSFSTYKRNWRECTGFSYPEIIFQPEREGGWVDYERELKKSRKSNPNRTLSDQVSVVFSYEIQKNKSLIEPLFTERWCKEYSEHLILVSSEEFPAINRLVLMLNTHFYGSVSDFMRAGKKNREMKATEILSQKNLLTCMQDPTVKEEIEKILYIKGTQLQKYILTKISWEKWTSFMDDFLNRYRYQEVTYEQFALELQELYGLDILPYTRKLYKEEGVPSFVVKDMNLYGMIDDGDKLMYSFKIWNRGLVDGVVTVEGSHYDPETASNKVFMENHEIRVNESKEFRFSAPIGFELNLWTNFSWNLPDNYLFSSGGGKVTGETWIRDADTLLLKSPQGEILVDNDAPGFEIVEKENAFFRQSEKKKVRPVDIFSGTSTFPVKWTLCVSDKAYGEETRSFYCKSSGKEKSRIEWNAEIQESGEYELFIFLPSINLFNDWCVADQHYLFYHDGKKDRITLQSGGKRLENRKVIVRYSDGGEEELPFPFYSYRSSGIWVPVGRYVHSTGKVKLELQDEMLEEWKIMLVDAVKWVKMETQSSRR